jgi:hypothetical protein
MLAPLRPSHPMCFWCPLIFLNSIFVNFVSFVVRNFYCIARHFVSALGKPYALMISSSYFPILG